MNNDGTIADTKTGGDWSAWTTTRIPVALTTAETTFTIATSAGNGPNNDAIAIWDQDADVPFGAPEFATADEAFTVAENSTAVGTVTAADSENDDVTYAITGGADQDQFLVDPTSGELTFNSAPDFETPADAEPDNVYEVEASDGAAATTQSIEVARRPRSSTARSGSSTRSN